MIFLDIQEQCPTVRQLELFWLRSTNPRQEDEAI